LAEHPKKTTPETTLDPNALARFGKLELVAKLIVEGLMSGLHKSPFKGFSVEFAEHRQYGPGDEIRHIDWRAFGKTDRYFVKEFEEETNLKCHLIVDTSGSMAFAGDSLSKLEYARRLAASLAYLMINQRDAVGLITFDSETHSLIPARTAPGHFSVICKALESARASGETPASHVLHALADRIKRRGFVIVLSDGFDQLDHLVSSLRHLRHRKHEVLFLQVLAPEEIDFPFRKPLKLRGLEQADRTVRIDPATLRSVYLNAFRAHCQNLATSLRAMKADYFQVSTATPPERALFDYLAQRAGRATRTF
jgi:uncharacterized protein (DUF58 family)